ncbi:MAG: hypothetical protein AAF479_12760 [Pseudomonadota bacterium]
MGAETDPLIPDAARIMEVMESWPLQLRILIGAHERIVDLDDAAVVMRDGIETDPGALAPGLLIRLQMGGADPQVVHLIEILGN